jgi:hypothetical protein
MPFSDLDRCAKSNILQLKSNGQGAGLLQARISFRVSTTTS